MKMDSRIGQYDLVIWVKERKKPTVEIGKVVKVSEEYKNRIGDNGNEDICGVPIYSWIYSKFFPSEFSTKIRPESVKLVTRNFRVGDMVKRRNNEVGFIEKISYTATIKLLNYDLVLHDVNMKQLKDPWNSCVLPNRLILYNGWIGILGSTIERSVYLKLNNSFTFQMAWKDFAVLVFVDGCVNSPEVTYEVNGFSFFPGRTFFITEKSLKKELLLGRMEFIESPFQLEMSTTTMMIEVIKTEIIPFSVNWIYQVEPKSPQPPHLLKLEHLRKVVWIPPIRSVSLGDVRLYKLTDADWDSAVNAVHWDAYLIHKYSLLRGNRRKHLAERLPPVVFPFDENFELDRKVPVEIVHITSKVQVGWTAGREEILDSVEVVGVKNNSEFSIGSFVQRKNDKDNNWKDKYGVIQRVSINVIYGHTAVVKWITRAQGWANFLGQNVITTEELKLTMLEHHSFYDFRSKVNENCIVACKVPQRRYHGFKAGFVINTYPDGMVRACDTSGNVCILWPDELLLVYPRQFMKANKSD